MYVIHAVSLLSLMQYYSSGVYSSTQCSSTILTHAMVITGYGSYNGAPYYLVKNRSASLTGMTLLPRHHAHRDTLHSKSSLSHNGETKI